MYEELKKAAEACKDLLPLRYMESHGSLYIRNDCGIVFDVHQNRSFPDFMAHNKAYADLALAANPSAVLALIAENEKLLARDKLHVQQFNELSDYRRRTVEGFDSKIAELEKENERLRREEKNDKIAYDAVRERQHEIRADRDQLKAENEALRTALTYIRDTSDDWHVCEKAADALKDSKDAG